MFTFYKAAIFIRKKLTALRRGDYRTYQAKRGSRLYIFERFTEEECIMIILNAGNSKETLDISFEDKLIIWQSRLQEDQLDGYGFVITRKKFEKREI